MSGDEDVRYYCPGCKSFVTIEPEHYKRHGCGSGLKEIFHISGQGWCVACGMEIDNKGMAVDTSADVRYFCAYCCEYVPKGDPSHACRDLYLVRADRPKCWPIEKQEL